MAWIIGTAVASVLGWLWWSGHGIGRIAAWLALAAVGCFWWAMHLEAQYGRIPADGRAEGGYVVVAALAWVVASVRVWLLRRGRQPVDVGVQRAPNILLQPVLPSGGGDRVPDGRTDKRDA